MRSTEVRLATGLVWLGALPAAGCLYLAYRAFTTTDDLLMVVLPVVGTVLLLTGFFLLGATVALAQRLQKADPRARLHAGLLGGGLAGVGLFVITALPTVGLPLALYGGALVYLMSTPAAAADLGPWRRSLQQTAPWGSSPGRGLWSPAAPAPGQHPSVPAGPQQGPWAPDPTTLPWLSWKGHTGPRAPWWQTWQAGLAQGIPLWELLLLCLSLLAFLVGLVTIPVVLAGSAHLGTLRLTDSSWVGLLVLLPVSGAVVAWLEQRMRVRLAGRR
ncbi:MAG TPA: hypothetical protein VM097_13875 [Mycobacteriales bacterium]|nr:hypothetical protein [Mycobacteriales bacterium]